MAKVRLEITKGDEIRYLAHLDYVRVMERALRRSKLPVAYSEWFNPHMKVAYASALSVGVASYAEYVDMEFAGEVSLDDVKERLAPQLPVGILLNRLKFIGDRTPALMAVVNMAIYKLTVPLNMDAGESQVAESLELFNSALHVAYVRESPKGRREIDLKGLMDAPVTAIMRGHTIELHMVIRITKSGSVKASEVLEALVNSFGLPVHRESARIDRTGLYIVDNQQRLTPLEVV